MKPLHELSLKELFAAARRIPRQPHAVRARVLARARAAAASPSSRLAEVPAVRPRRFGSVLARAAALVAAAGGLAGTAYALSGAWSPRPDAAPATSTSRTPVEQARSAEARAPLTTAPSALVETEDAPAPAPSTPAPPPSAEVSPTPPERAHRAPKAASEARRSSTPTAQGSYEAELELLRSAHTAYAARDYSNALLLTGEHARRFANGALAEQREALRIRCLSGAGRAAEARRAVAAFAKRFPRSVLLRRLETEVGVNPSSRK